MNDEILKNVTRFRKPLIIGLFDINNNTINNIIIEFDFFAQIIIILQLTPNSVRINAVEFFDEQKKTSYLVKYNTI